MYCINKCSVNTAPHKLHLCICSDFELLYCAFMNPACTIFPFLSWNALINKRACNKCLSTKVLRAPCGSVKIKCDVLTLMPWCFVLNIWPLSFTVQLWTVGNYHWYLKQSLHFGSEPLRAPACVCWDPEKPLRLHLLTRGWGSYTYDWGWCTERSHGTDCHDNANVAVIDGGRHGHCLTYE